MDKFQFSENLVNNLLCGLKPNPKTKSWVSFPGDTETSDYVFQQNLLSSAVVAPVT